MYNNSVPSFNLETAVGEDSAWAMYFALQGPTTCNGQPDSTKNSNAARRNTGRVLKLEAPPQPKRFN